MGLVLVLRHKLLCIHVYKGLQQVLTLSLPRPTYRFYSVLRQTILLFKGRPMVVKGYTKIGSFQHHNENDCACVRANSAKTCLPTYHASPKTMVIFRCFFPRRKVKHLPLVFASAGKRKCPHMVKQFRYFEDCLCSSFTNRSSRP